MTAYDDWKERHPAWRAAEIDFGTTWRRDHDPDETWRVSWNTGTGELIAVTRSGSDIETLGQFDSLNDVTDALPDWAEQALRPGGLDEARRQVTLYERARLDAQTNDPARHPEPDASWYEAEHLRRLSFAGVADYWLNEGREPPRWHEYLADCDRVIAVEGRWTWQPRIELDYAEWDRLSRHPDWYDYLNSIPDDAVRAEPFEDWLARSHPSRNAVPASPLEVYGMVIRPDGSTSPLHEHVSIEIAEEHVGTETLDLAPVHPNMTSGRPLHMLVDDLGHAKGLQVNPLATLLYGNGWPILGTAVLFDDNGDPLPRSLSEGLNTDPVPAIAGPGSNGIAARPLPHRLDHDVAPRDPKPDDGMDLS